MVTKVAQRIGLIAGNGQFPLVWARAAKSNGSEVVAIGIKEETEPELESLVDEMHWVSFQQLAEVFTLLQEKNIQQAVMSTRCSARSKTCIKKSQAIRSTRFSPSKR